MESGEGGHENPHFAQSHTSHQSGGILSDLRVSILTGLQENGWFVLLAAVLAYLAYTKISNSRNSPTSSRSNTSSRGNGSVAREDPDKILERQEKVAVARARMQAMVDEKAAEEKIKVAEREEQAREKKIQEWENLQTGKGYYSKMKSTNEVDTSVALNKMTSEKKMPSKSAKKDYNPLMGDSSSSASCSWRPATRRMGGGG